MRLNWRAKFRLFQISTYALVFLAIGLMAFLTNKCIETVFLFASFVWLRNCFGKTYHSTSFWACIVITILVFVVAIAFVPNKNLSLFSCILFGLVIDYIAYKYKDYQDTREEIAILNAPKPFSVNTCTEEELVERCRELHLSEENTNLAIEFFIKKTKHSVLADNLCIEEKSVQEKKRRLKQKLNQT